jgi:hypothetical protein
MDEAHHVCVERLERATDLVGEVAVADEHDGRL